MRFYHFTGFDSGAGHAATQVFGKGMPAVSELWTIFEEKLRAFGHAELRKCSWKYACFSNGEHITDDMRLLYRVRTDLQQAFPNPFDLSNPTWNYLYWYKNQEVEGESKRGTNREADSVRGRRRHSGDRRGLRELVGRRRPGAHRDRLDGLVPAVRDAGYQYLLEGRREDGVIPGPRAGTVRDGR